MFGLLTRALLEVDAAIVLSAFTCEKTSDELSFGHTLQQLPKFKVLFILGLYFYEKLSSALI